MTSAPEPQPQAQLQTQTHAQDAEFMRRALLVAERGRGRTSPNPMVGALIVSPDGVIVGRGYHERAGEPHAEINALRDAGAHARGATLYCTLEPCCHTGRTGPCSVAVAQAGIRRLVAAVADPNPLVAGGGFRYLRDHNVDVTSGVLQHQAARLNDVFFTNVTRKRPHVTMKIALSADGRIAAARGKRTAITSRESNRHAQRFRAEVDAIAIGSETLLVDDPILTVRDLYRYRPLTRIVFDTRLRTSPTARLLTTLDAGPVIIVTTELSAAANAERVRALERAGARIMRMPTPSPVPTHDLAAALSRLYRDAGVCSILLEGGAAIHTAAWNAGVVDRVRMYVTPDALGPDGVRWDMPASFAWMSLYDKRIEACGPDSFMEGHVYGVD